MGVTHVTLLNVNMLPKRQHDAYLVKNVSNIRPYGWRSYNCRIMVCMSKTRLKYTLKFPG